MHLHCILYFIIIFIEIFIFSFFKKIVSIKLFFMKKKLPEEKNECMA